MDSGELKLSHIEDLLDIFVLGAQNDNNMQKHHRKTNKDAFEIDPEYLAPIPRIDHIVEAGSDDRNIHKGDLKESVSVNALIILHPLRESRFVVFLLKQLRILNSEQLE